MEPTTPPDLQDFVTNHLELAAHVQVGASVPFGSPQADPESDSERPRDKQAPAPAAHTKEFQPSDENAVRDLHICSYVA